MFRAIRRSLSTAATTQMNLYTALNDAMRIALETDDTALLFGEDVAFGGVFRCSVGLKYPRVHCESCATPADLTWGASATAGTGSAKSACSTRR